MFFLAAAATAATAARLRPHLLPRFTSFSRAYSDAIIPPNAIRKWGLAGVPRPKSIFDDDDAPVDLSEDDDLVNGTRPGTPPLHMRHPPDRPTPQEWRQHREAMKKAFPSGWAPPRKISREAMDGIRRMHRIDPETFTTPVLAEKFRISPEAVRRILKSKWEPTREKRIKLAEKEREHRAAVIKQSRLKERSEARQLMELKKSASSSKSPASAGKTYGVGPWDRLTLE